MFKALCDVMEDGKNQVSIVLKSRDASGTRKKIFEVNDEKCD